MTEQHEHGAADKDRQVERRRSSFKALLAANPNYFGTFPDLGWDPVEPQGGDTSYEDISCVAYSPVRDRIEATVLITRDAGYGGGPCTRGSVEHLRFYIDYGGGWEDAGPAGIVVHDLPVGRDCPGDPTHPLSYVTGVAHAPRRRWCGNPVLPRVRAILSWELPPPPDQPDWVPVWGTTRDATAQIRPRRFIFPDIVRHLPKDLVATLPPKVLHQPPVPDPDPEPGPVEPLGQLVERYARLDVPQHRLAFPLLAATTSEPSVTTAGIIEQATLAQEVGLDLESIVKILEDTSGNTSYEELHCLGLDTGLSSLVASYTVKRPSGYSGGPCSAGSTQYVAFWADWDDDCRYQYLGTVQTPAHDYDVPDGGLSYAVILPVDLHALERDCDTPVLPRVRAVLSWGTPPSTTDPDLVPVWGNRIDRHVQIQPGPGYTGQAAFWKVGGVAATKVDPVTGLTTPGATLGVSVVPLDPRGCPFAGTVTLHAVPDPALAGRQYRVRAIDVDGGGSVYLTTPFSVVTGAGTPGAVTPDPVTGWAPWPTSGLFGTNPEGTLAVHSPGGDHRWEYHLELDAPGNVVSTARAQMDNTVRSEVLPTDPVNAGDLDLDTLGACNLPHGPLHGTFVARDRHFASWSIGLLGGPGGPLPPTPLTVGLTIGQETPLTGTPFTLDLSSPALAPCGYVVRLTIVDRAIVNSVTQGHHTTIDRGICLE